MAALDAMAAAGAKGGSKGSSGGRPLAKRTRLQEEKADATAAAAAASPAKPVTPATPAPSTSSSSSKAEAAPEKPASPVPRREAPDMSPAALAALKRTEAASSNISDDKAAALRLRREKDELLGRIEVIAKEKGVTVPFGLPAAAVPAIRKYLEELRARK
eukprot:Rhum_TRINITY_DN9335_c2_g1::Rhum_TRINITY_DN9335_c2_g1_i1::g.32797::m.32797